MLIAEIKKKENIAEYLLYMWQIEDIIRANHFDIEQIYKNVIDKFDQPENIKSSMKEWYQNLTDMMIRENIEEYGHLEINNHVIVELTDLHKNLLHNGQETNYITTYYKTLPFIVELRAKAGEKSTSEIETSFSALYGYLLLKMQQKAISGETQAAIAQISSLLRLLAEKYKQQKND